MRELGARFVSKPYIPHQLKTDPSALTGFSSSYTFADERLLLAYGGPPYGTRW
jgi:hypothetical protein